MPRIPLCTTCAVSYSGDSPSEIIGDFLASVRHTLDRDLPGFSTKFLQGAAIDQLVDEIYIDVHRRHAVAQPRFADCVT
jgi:O-acetylhomoserine (thiol)-lyase